MTRSEIPNDLEYFAVKVTLLLGGAVVLLLTAVFVFLVGPYIAIALAGLIGLVGIVAVIFALVLLISKSLVERINKG